MEKETCTHRGKGHRGRAIERKRKTNRERERNIHLHKLMEETERMTGREVHAERYTQRKETQTQEGR